MIESDGLRARANALMMLRRRSLAGMAAPSLEALAAGSGFPARASAGAAAQPVAPLMRELAGP